jgi:predicted ABC-type ATPase
LGITEYVNPDIVAQGLSGFDPDSVALQAARIMLARLRELAAGRVSFAFETTLASRSYVPWLADLIAEGYAVHLVYLWLASAGVAVQRVAERLRMGGHAVPEATIRRRYIAGLQNLFKFYLRLATTWRVYDNGRVDESRLVASGGVGLPTQVRDRAVWRRMRGAAR